MILNWEDIEVTVRWSKLRKRWESLDYFVLFKLFKNIFVHLPYAIKQSNEAESFKNILSNGLFVDTVLVSV